MWFRTFKIGSVLVLMVSMCVRLWLLLVVFLLTSAATPSTSSVDYTPTRLFFTIYGDGVVSVEYSVDVDPTLARLNVTVFGDIFSDVLIVDQDGLPLSFNVSYSVIEVDSLGSTSVTIEYSTPELTSKTGSLWIFNVTTLLTSSISLPAASTITSLSSVPLEVGTLNGNPYVSMPAGRTEVSYVIGVVGTKEHAQIALRDAEASLAAIELEGVDISEAEALLVQAQASFDAGRYADTEQLANEAKEKADEAYRAAQAARQGIDLLTIVAVAGAAAIAFAIALNLRGRRGAEAVAGPKTRVDLNAIFDGDPGLRMDDREVLRFIADSGGEAFANEIRERFDLPRTSAWRMFRRLIGIGIVEERKIGGQSLIRISGRYREGGAAK